VVEKQKIPPSISLVVIVRDEARNISQLLDDLAPLVEEAVVVDTGSTDDTADQATDRGAKVVHFKWCDDFAAARNFGIAAATCGWILTIDADERIAGSDFSVVKQAIKDGTPKSYFFTQRNYSDLLTHPEWRPSNGKYPEQEGDLGGFIEAHQIRLFPNLEELRYHGCIHETIRGCSRAGVEKDHLEVTVHHFGHMQTGVVAARRNNLYSRLTREKLRRNPDDGDACFQMATRHMEEGHNDLALPLLEKLVANGAADHPATTRGNIALGRLLSDSGYHAAAFEQFELAVQQKPEWLLCWMEVLSLLVQESRWTETAKYLTGARMLFPDEALLLKFECRLLIATGDFLAAANKANTLAEQYPNWPGAERLAVLCRELVEKGKV